MNKDGIHFFFVIFILYSLIHFYWNIKKWEEKKLAKRDYFLLKVSHYWDVVVFVDVLDGFSAMFVVIDYHVVDTGDQTYKHFLSPFL